MTSLCRLICKDGEIIEVDIETARQSVLISGLIEDGGVEEEIVIAQVNKPVMEKILTFCEHMREYAPPEIEQPLSSTEMTHVVD